MNVISARVVEFRKRKGLTQEQLAEKINVSRGVLAGVESGMRGPSKEMAKKLSVFFKVPVELFLFEEAQTPAEQNKTISTANVLLIADIVEEYLKKNGFKITTEQRAALVDHFYQQNITEPEKIKESLSLLRAMQFGLTTKK